MQTTVKSLEGSRQELFIGGQFRAPRSASYLQSFDPTTGKPWYEFAEANAEDVDAAIASATEAFHSTAWRRITPTERGKLVRRLAELVLEHADELALICTLEEGKTLPESRGEAVLSLSLIHI